MVTIVIELYCGFHVVGVTIDSPQGVKNNYPYMTVLVCQDDESQSHHEVYQSPNGPTLRKNDWLVRLTVGVVVVRPNGGLKSLEAGDVVRIVAKRVSVRRHLDSSGDDSRLCFSAYLDCVVLVVKVSRNLMHCARTGGNTCKVGDVKEG